MAMKKTSDAEKALKHLKPDGGKEGVLSPKTENHLKELMMKLTLSPSEDKTKAEPRLFKPKAGTVFPAKKRLVKKMMFDQMVQWFCSVSDYITNRPSSTAASNANKVICNNNHVYPSPLP